MANELIVVAIGGNSLIRDARHETVPDQWAATRDTCQRIADLIAAGYRVVVTHGNGPQVGFIVRRSELGRSELHDVPLDSCDADTQGAIGYMIQQSLHNELRRRGLARSAVTVVTQVEVDAADPAFAAPQKPIGSFMDRPTAEALAAREGWTIREDAGRGWRRVVPSPRPRVIVEADAIRDLAQLGYVVTAVGGGGIPVVRGPDGMLRGIEAVIDKDHASALLATELGADRLVVSTAVERVCLDHGTPTERALSAMTVAEARAHAAAGQFAPGSMGPKIEAMVDYVVATGRPATLTTPEQLVAAVAGRAGTTITR
jgi:carbamate kinase